VILGFFVLVSIAAHAQTNQGAIAGNIFDATGAVVPNAVITATNEQTGNVYKSTSTSAGNYRFPEVQLGRYTVVVQAPGFKESSSTNVLVQIGNVSALDIQLQIGSSAETVTVIADAPRLQTEASDVSGNVGTKQILELPLALGGVGQLRSPEAFIFLIPGTVGPGSANSGNGIFISKIGGGQNFGAEVLIDGASQTRSENGSSFDEEAPSVEAISEFKVTTSTPPAEFGRTTGGIENFVTKSGTNQYHGTGFEIFRNEDLNANDWFQNGYLAMCAPGDAACRTPHHRGADKKHDFGGSIGGPLSVPHLYNAKDRLFGFFSWEQYRQAKGGTTITTVPTAAERTGNFSDRLLSPLLNANGSPVLNVCDGTPIIAGQIFDPATEKTVNRVNGDGSITRVRCRSAFSGNTIPQARFNSVSNNIMKFYPAPQNGDLQNNYSNNTPYPINNTTYSIRIDGVVTQNHKVWGTYSARENTDDKALRTFPDPVENNQWQQDFITHFFRTGWDYAISPNLLNHLVFGSNRSNSINFTAAANGKTNWAKQLGIGNVNSTIFPVIRANAEGIPQLGKAQADANVDNGLRLNDSVNWVHGRHSFKFGGDYRWQQYSNIAHDNEAGNFNFSANQTRVDDSTTPSTGNGLASLLLGGLNDLDLGIRNHQPRWISNYYAIFAQDDLKLSPNLTINVGLRYDVDQPRREALNQTSNFSPTAIDPYNGRPGALVFASNCQSCNKRWADTWFKDFGPRLGFAYTPPVLDGKVVVRGGYSIVYGPLQYTDFGGGMLQGYSANPSFGSDGFEPAFNLGKPIYISDGFPSFTPPPNLDPGQYDNRDASSPISFSNYIKPSYGRPSMIQQWNMQIQQELAHDLIATIGYIGSHGTHLRSGIENLNNMPIADFQRGNHLVDDRFSPTTSTVDGVASPYAGFNGQLQQALRPFPQYGFIATDSALQNVGNSTFNALVATVERRFSNGFNLQASYTWSKTITNSDSLLPGINGGVAQEQNPFDAKADKAVSIQDIPQTFVVSYIYELPFGKGRKFLNSNRLADLIVGGWQIGGVQRYQSGQPLSFGCADGIPGWDNCIRFTRIPGSDLASHVKHINPFYRDQNGPNPRINSLFNGLKRPDAGGYAALQPNPALISQNAFVNRGTGPYSFGNMPRVSTDVRNGAYYNEDFSLIKNFHVTEGVFFQLKGEFLNALNRHIFSTPDLNPYDNTYGVPGGTIDGPRNVQITGRITF
jgi:Carboxypeptidase regulatory-like domain